MSSSPQVSKVQTCNNAKFIKIQKWNKEHSELIDTMAEAINALKEEIQIDPNIPEIFKNPRFVVHP